MVRNAWRPSLEAVQDRLGDLHLKESEPLKLSLAPRRVRLALEGIEVGRQDQAGPLHDPLAERLAEP
jgi:hypothetical protein